MNYERIYKYRFRQTNLNAKLGVWRHIARKVHDLMGHPQRVLDPAGGQLEFIGQIDAKEKWVVDLVKHESVAATTGINYVVSNIFDADLPKNFFDGIFISNFLEHLATPSDIYKLLTKLHSHMASGSTIAIMGPNFKYSYKDYFDFADHILPLSHSAVMEHLYSAGFEIDRVIPRFVPFSFNGLLPPIPFLAKCYLELPLAWPILGKQFLVIAKKL
jgi:hypothetical protein